MSSLLDLAVSLTAKTGKFTAGFRKARKTVRTLTASIKPAITAVAKYGAAAGAAAAGGLALLTRQSWKTITATHMVARRLNMATKTLSSFQYAVRQTQGDPERLAEGIQELMQRLGEAMKAKTGSAFDELGILGMDAADLIRKGPAKAIMELSDRINEIPSAAERAFAWDELMGGDSRELLNFLTMGSKRMQALMAEADKLGVSFTDLSAQKIQMANRALTKVKSVLIGVGNTIAIQVAPHVEVLGERLASLATQSEGFANKIVNGMRWIAKISGIVVDHVYGTFRIGFHAVREVVYGVIRSVVDKLSAMVTAVSKMANKLPEFLGFKNVFDAEAKTVELWAKDLGKQHENSIKTFMDAHKDLVTEKYKTAFTNYFDSIQRDATKKAQKAVEAVKKVNESDAAKMRTPTARIPKDPGQFKSVSLRRFAVNPVGVSGSGETRIQGMQLLIKGVDTLGAKIDKLRTSPAPAVMR